MVQTSTITKIGIIGAGVIGSFLSEQLKKFENVALFVYDKDTKAICALKEKSITFTVTSSLSELINKADVIIEAAHPDVVGDILTIIHDKKIYHKKVMCMSIGGILNNLKLYNDLLSKHVKIYLPTGAIAGIDLIESASNNITNIILQTTKSPKSLNLNTIAQKQIMFEGSVQDAIKKYPQNINIAARIALAVKDESKVKVRIIVDPDIKTNQHEVFIEGDFGKAYFKIENIPSPNNPKTSYLACLSALQKVKEIINLN